MSDISRKALIKEIENEIRTYKELGAEFDERRYELIGWQAKINRGLFDIPSTESEGEATRLRAALKMVQSEVAFYATASVYEKVCDIVNEALSSTPIASREQKVRKDIVKIINDLELEYGYGTIDIATFRNILADRIIAHMLGITIPGINTGENDA